MWTPIRIALAGVLATTAAAAGTAVTGLADKAARYEEPAYRVVRTTPDFEVRAYAPTVEARVTVPGAYNEAVSGAFRVLAGYIFGGNASRASIAMTTPVAAVPAGERIAMTTPVSASEGARGWTVSFTMPSDRTLDSLPVPNDPRVTLVEVPGGTWAVRTFSGRATDAVVARELATLDRAVAREGLKRRDDSLVAQYDPPWVLGPWRRNDVRWRLDDPPGS